MRGRHGEKALRSHLVTLSSPHLVIPPQPTTKFTSFFGTYSRFFIVLPSIHGLAPAAPAAVVRIVSSSASAGTLILSRSLPLTCTGSSIVDSTSFAGSYVGQGRRARLFV